MEILGAILGCGFLLSLSGILFPLVGPPGMSRVGTLRVRFWTLTPGVVILVGVAVIFLSVVCAWGAPYRTSGGPGTLERSLPSIQLVLGLPLLPFYFLCRLFFPQWTSAEHYPEFLLPVSLLDAYGWTAIIYLVRKASARFHQT
jgi:hypothetical protein